MITRIICWSCVLGFVGFPLLQADDDAATARALVREAASAAEQNNSAEFLAKMEAAVALRGDLPRMLFDLAAAQVVNERLDDAVATLERLAALGLHLPVEKAEEFKPLRGRKDFEAVIKKLAANLQPKGKGELAFTLREVTGLIEGIAWREKTGEFYFSDVHARAVWMRNKDGKLRRFSPEGEELFGAFGLAVDETNGALWVATAAVPEMQGFSSELEGKAALVELDLDSGAIRRTFEVTRRSVSAPSHVFGDLALAPDGSIYVTDSRSPTVWRLAPGGEKLEAWLESTTFVSLQGAVVRAGGDVLLVADYANGLFRIDVGSRSITKVGAPPDATLVGLDGLVLLPGGDVVAIQNGARPNRVLRLTFDSGGENVERVAVLESGHLTVAAPSLGCLGPKGNFFFVGNAAWSRFESGSGEPPAPRPVPIFKTKIE